MAVPAGTPKEEFEAFWDKFETEIRPMLELAKQEK